MIIIYGLKCNKTNMLYIGSTKKPLNLRLSAHKSIYNNCVSKKIIDNNDYIIYEIEQCDENMRKEREQYWIDNTDNINDKRVIGLDIERVKERMKIYDSKRPSRKDEMKKIYKYQKTWGGDKRWNNNLLVINPNLFNL